MSVIGLQGYITPAIGDENLAPVKVQIDNLITESGKPKATPDYDKEVLQPLHESQAAIAAAQAKEQAAEAEREAEAQAQIQLEAQQEQDRLAALYAGSHEDWMRAAGIDPANWGYVNYIVTHESGWNPNAVNPTGGACGLGQQLPCGKWAGAWNDPIAALVGMQGYVNSRYGGWYGAYLYWVSHGNY